MVKGQQGRVPLYRLATARSWKNAAKSWHIHMSSFHYQSHLKPTISPPHPYRKQLHLYMLGTEILHAGTCMRTSCSPVRKTHTQTSLANTHANTCSLATYRLLQQPYTCKQNHSTASWNPKICQSS